MQSVIELRDPSGKLSFSGTMDEFSLFLETNFPEIYFEGVPNCSSVAYALPYGYTLFRNGKVVH